MKLVNYQSDSGPSAGVLVGDTVFDLKLGDLDKVLTDGALEGTRTSDRGLTRQGGMPLSRVKLLPPVLRPEKILCVAVNYVSHSKEQGVAPPPEPYFFTKFRNAIVGDGDDILVPRVSTKVDWEVELAVVIGKPGKYIPKGSAMDHVAGYTISNDVSFRDLQFPPGWPEKLNALGQNWVMGKGLDTAFPLGPCLVTKDQIQDPHNLRISLNVNGETKQESNTSEMVFKIDALIEYVSKGMTLRPGDIISTGTPLGVAVFTDKRFLKSGDAVEATIEGIGTLRNRVRAE